MPAWSATPELRRVVSSSSGAEFMRSPKAARPRAIDGPASDIAVARAVEDFQHGIDREASFRLLVERFYRPVLSFFSRRVASPEDRRDLAQETFLRAYRGLAGFRGESRFSTWLFRIAHHTYISWSQRETGGPEESIDESFGLDSLRGGGKGGSGSTLAAPQPHADVVLLDRERRRHLRDAIDGLPVQMARCMKLRVIHELSYREIADAMRLSLGTVKAHLFKGRERLAVELRDGYDEADA